MSADTQYADARKAIDFIESAFLPAGKFTTYGAVCEALGYKPSRHARHEWKSKDMGVIRSMLNHMNGEGALAQWARIEGFGHKAQERALTHL